MKKLIAYDLDGTLADTRKDIVLGVNYMLTEMGVPALPSEVIESYVGKGLRELMKSALRADDPKKVEQAAKVFRRYYEKHLMDHTVLYPGAIETLNFFGERLQAVVTNKPNPFSEIMLKELGVRHFFSHVATGEPGQLRKPDPEAFFRIMADLELTPDEVLFVGDSGIDLEAGKRAGIETVIISHGFTSRDRLESLSPEYLVDTFDEILELAIRRSW